MIHGSDFYRLDKAPHHNLRPVTVTSEVGLHHQFAEVNSEAACSTFVFPGQFRLEEGNLPVVFLASSS